MSSSCLSRMTGICRLYSIVNSPFPCSKSGALRFAERTIAYHTTHHTTHYTTPTTHHTTAHTTPTTHHTTPTTHTHTTAPHCTAHNHNTLPFLRSRSRSRHTPAQPKFDTLNSTRSPPTQHLRAIRSHQSLTTHSPPHPPHSHSHSHLHIPIPDSDSSCADLRCGSLAKKAPAFNSKIAIDFQVESERTCFDVSNGSAL